MSNDTLASKIELLQEQIQNLEKSGYFTEKEMDKLSYPLRQELEVMEKQLAASRMSEIAKNSGLTADEMIQGCRTFSELWLQMNEPQNFPPIFSTTNKTIEEFINEIQVIDAEILTPNQITA